MTIKIGWWLIPLLFTVCAFIWAKMKSPEPKNGHYMPDFVTPVLIMANYGLALLLSLAAWLIWAIAT